MVLASLLALAGCASPPWDGGVLRFAEEFEGPVANLADGDSWGSWLAMWAGGGQVSVGSGLLRMSPAPPAGASDTRSALVVGPNAAGPMAVEARLRTVEQLRSPTPNPWESAWLVWAVRDSTERGVEMEYVAVKPNGLELGIVDHTPVEPGATCRWPDLSGCLHPGGQRFVATVEPGVPVGRWAQIRVVRDADHCRVLLDGVELISVPMPAPPAGRVGFYGEDSTVELDSLSVRSP